MPDQRELAANYLRAAKALKSAMERSLTSPNSDEFANIGKYTSFRTFAQKYNALIDEYSKSGGAVAVGVSKFNLDVMHASGDYTWPMQKEIFDMVYTEVCILIASLEGVAGIQEQAASELKEFFGANLRRAMLHPPEKERAVQDVVEMLLIGKGLAKGTGYDRETGRVKYSGKEFVPDFVIPGQSIAIEVKFIDDDKRTKSVIDEMNADIPALKTRYERVLFIVYDMGFVRDEHEFRSGLEKSNGVDVCIVKH